MEKNFSTDSLYSLFRKSIQEDKSHVHIIVIFGASGDLAKKKIYPSLWHLYRAKLLPEIRIIGYSRSHLTVGDLRKASDPYMKVKDNEKEKFDEFWKESTYFPGSFDNENHFMALDHFIDQNYGPVTNKIFYLAVPPFLFATISENIAKHIKKSEECFNRLIVEKPFGRDLKSSQELSLQLARNFSEEKIYRIDHYLGKEMVQNLLMIRFGNTLFEPLWSARHIDNVMISFKESFGTQGRGGYFDKYGIIRDVIQNHLIQILCLVAMEKPVTKLADDIREEKVRVLRKIQPINMKDVVLGQYTGNPMAAKDSEEYSGYLDDPTVPKDSRTETYACMVLKVNNDRWKDVPFILRAGKALNERKAEVRIQFKSVGVNIFDDVLDRNELVIRVQPNEAVYVNMMTKSPGMGYNLETTQLDLTYNKRYKNIVLMDAYERLLIDIMCGNQTNFVRSDELEHSWIIFDPLLKEIENRKIKPTSYVFGSRNGPAEADELIRNNGFVYSGRSTWQEE